MFNLEQVKEYYSTHNHIYGQESGTIRDKVCNYIIDNFTDSHSFFEFGCNVGYNLARIRDKYPDGEFFGIDINEFAITLGKTNLNLNLLLGDENTLDNIQEFDVVFTSSVLNHIPDGTISKVIENLKRISKKHVMFMEANVDQEPAYYFPDYEKFGLKKAWEVFSPVSRKGHDVMYYGWTL